MLIDINVINIVRTFYKVFRCYRTSGDHVPLPLSWHLVNYFLTTHGLKETFKNCFATIFFPYLKK